MNPVSGQFDPVKFAQLVPLETAAALSTQGYAPIIQAAGAKVQVHITGDGIHWWNYWQARMHESWYGTLAPALGTA